MAAAATLNYVAISNSWLGQSTHAPAQYWIDCVLDENPVFPNYKLSVTYHAENVYGPINTWETPPFQSPRPYVGQELKQRLLLATDYATAIVREIPS
ncbi:hypothetical protein LCGC14_1176050 [marine sediment metagenome]|uniref:Uncharacterized protein n=1 Tax=marine sediment metagenome TaxID=412755 RepID=A0A0F9PTW4_9ZZZZ